MKRAFAIAAVVLTLLAAFGASFAIRPSLAGPAAAAILSAAQDAVPNFNFAPPINASATDFARPGVMGAANDGTVSIAFNNLENNSVLDSQNTTFYGPFQDDEWDASDSGVGSQRMISDSHGRLHVIWYHGFSNGNAVVYYGRKNPGAAWQIGALDFTETGPANGGSYKVLGIARGQTVGDQDQIVIMWGRNGVGARVSWTLDGVHWAPYENVPAAYNSQATDFNVGATTGGYIFVGWFERAPYDVFVQMRPPNGIWGPGTDISNRPEKGQDYGPRFGTGPDGGLRVAWTGYPFQGASGTEGFFREWNPTTGWSHTIVQLWANPGAGNSRALELTVDPAGVSHIVWDDDSGRPERDVATLYIRGAGTEWSTPQNVYPQFGQASSRYPYLDVGPVPGQGVKVHVVTNSNVSGQFDSWYTWTDANVSSLPTATPTKTFTPTRTPTKTPTPSPTPCTAGTYSDVPTNFPFYPYIHDLAVRGAISGYADCTFRPFNNITRSQVAKVVILADGYQLISPPNPDFADVPYGSAFYDFVETAYSNHLISGYNCGGPGEPCDPENRPYFRPFANVTRGQLSKLVVIGAQWSLLSPTSPTFADVVPGTAFYTFVETAYAHAIVSGYTCGGPGEPCDPSDRPYFRQFNTATRAQASKIIDLALYSENITPTPAPTATETAVPTDTPIPPTDTPVPPTNTPGPPTATSTPLPPTATATATPLLPTVTVTIPLPLNTPTATATP